MNPGIPCFDAVLVVAFVVVGGEYLDGVLVVCLPGDVSDGIDDAGGADARGRDTVSSGSIAIAVTSGPPPIGALYALSNA